MTETEKEAGTEMVTMSQYRIDDRKILGEGSTAVVYAGTDLKTGVPVAFKRYRVVLDKHDHGQDQAREIRMYQVLDKHENITRLLEVQRKWDNVLKAEWITLVLEHEESTLADWQIPAVTCRLTKMLRTDWEVPPPEVTRRLAKMLLTGLAYIHSKDIIHRDIKPQNILTNMDGTHLKIIDFSSAKRLPRKDRKRKKHDREKTVFASFDAGTVTTRAIEVFLGADRHTTAMDIWSAGVVIAELAEGKRFFPYGDNCDYSWMISIFRVLGTPGSDSPLARLPYYTPNFPQWKPKPFDAGLLPKLSAAGRDLLSRMLEYDPQKRITAAQALRHPYFDEDDRSLATPDG